MLCVQDLQAVQRCRLWLANAACGWHGIRIVADPDLRRQFRILVSTGSCAPDCRYLVYNAMSKSFNDGSVHWCVALRYSQATKILIIEMMHQVAATACIQFNVETALAIRRALLWHSVEGQNRDGSIDMAHMEGGWISQHRVAITESQSQSAISQRRSAISQRLVNASQRLVNVSQR